MGERLRQMRRAAGLSEQELARASGLSPDLVSGLEQGQESDPRLSTVLALARALGVSLDRLAQDSDEPAGERTAQPPAASAAPPPAEELQAQAASPPPQPLSQEAEMPVPQSKPHSREAPRPRGS